MIFRYFEISKIRQNSNFQLFSIFSFAEWSQYNILSVRKNRINLSHLLVFNIAKTAENAFSAGKPRIVRKLSLRNFFNPKIRDQRPKTNRKRYSNILEPWVPQILLSCVIATPPPPMSRYYTVGVTITMFCFSLVR